MVGVGYQSQGYGVLYGFFTAVFTIGTPAYGTKYMGEKMSSILENMLYLAIVHWMIMLSPGQILIYILNISNHPKLFDKYMIVLGISCASVVNCALVIVGLATVIATFPKLQTLIAILGALYLGWLGYKNILLFWHRTDKVRLHQDITLPKNFFWTGYILNTFNPKTFIFQLSIFSQVLPKHNVGGNAGWEPYIYGIQVPLQSLMCWTMVTALAHTPIFQIFFDMYELKIKMLFGILLIYFAIQMVVTSI